MHACRVFGYLLWTSTLILGGPTSAQVLTDDAYTSSATPGTNHGGSAVLNIGPNSKAYLDFNLATLPSGLNGSNVSKATLILYVDAMANPGTFDAYQLTTPWSESTITYNNAPALGGQILGGVSVSRAGFIVADVTSAVQAWMNGTQTNNGFALVPSPGSSIRVSFDSKENSRTSHVAQLSLVLLTAGVAGRCYDNANRFVDCGNGTVTDTETGLIWLKNANCFPIMDYATTNNDAAGLHSGQCGLTDGSAAGSWRLPTIAEWQAIVQPSCSGPVLPDKLGNGCYATNLAGQWAIGVQTAYCYWSSTALAGDPNSAWSSSLNIYDILSGWKTNFCFVWPVRGGGSGNEVQR